MANQYSADVPKGFNVSKQVRLDSITAIQNENALKNLGTGNNLAFKYYENLKVYCKDEKTEYIWREVVGFEEGLLDTNFTYPTYPAVDGINYSGKSFNFFLVPNSNTIPPDGSETKINAGTNITKSGTGTIADPYVISSNLTIPPTLIIGGNNITVDGDGSLGDEYIISADLTDLGIVKTVGNEVIAPGQTLSIINNETTGKVLTTKEYVQSLIPPIPNGSETKINAGTNVSMTGNGTIATPYVINSITEPTTTYINSGDNVAIIGNGTVENPYVISSTDTDTTYLAGTGISLIGNTFNNTLPDQTVAFTSGGATSITGTYPNFNISSTDTNTTYTAGGGLSLTGTVFSVENLQKVLTYPADFTASNYTLTNADNNYEIIINNGATAVSITVPAGLTSKIGVGFTQKGTGNVTFISQSVTIHNPIGLKIKGQYYQTYLSQEGNTDIFYLGGNTKV